MPVVGLGRTDLGLSSLCQQNIGRFHVPAEGIVDMIVSLC
jgi:hypothetical protein